MADFDFVETDSAKLYSTVIGSLMDYCDEALYPGDQRRIFGEAIVAVFVSLYSEFNDKMKQRTLQYARGSVLDAIGDRYNVARVAPTSASATFRFSVSDVQSENIIIPAGTRITADGSVYFATNETAVLSAGDFFVDVVGYCSEGGAAYNRLASGSIATLVDLIPYISNVANITETSGGADGEPYTEEGDESFRERIRLAPAALSTAGPESAYRYFVMSADPDITDVSIVCPEDQPNVVNIYPLLTNGKRLNVGLIAKINSVMGGDVRPMTDKVVVADPEVVEYELEIKYFTTTDNEAATIETIEGEGGAIDQYIEWQSAALGRDINPDQLRRFILAPAAGVGAFRVDVVKPSFTDLSKSQVAKLSGTPVVTHEVVTG